MPKPDLGRKHECSECGARFYDLGKEPATCPKCGKVSTFALGAIPERKRRRREEVAPQALLLGPFVAHPELMVVTSMFRRACDDCSASG